MKPSLDVILQKMGKGRVPSKRIIAKEIQRLINDVDYHKSAAKVEALLWVIRGENCEQETFQLHNMVIKP